MTAQPFDALDRRCLYGLVLLVALGHGLLALNTGMYWDDYVICDWLKEGNWARFYEVGDTMGNLGYTYLYWPFRLFGDPCTALKFAVLLCLLVTPCLVYLTVRESGLVDRFAAFFLAAAAVLYPGHMMTFAANIAGHFFSYLGFALAAWCTVRSESRTGKWRYAYRGIAYAAFVVSYFMPSFLAFHFGFLLVLFLATGRDHPMRFAARQGDLLLLPFAYWAAHQWINPVHGWAKEWGYNEIRLDMDRMLPIYGNLLRVVAHSWLYYIEPFVACVAILAGVIWLAQKIFPRWNVPRHAGGARGAIVALALGATWLVLAVFPYAAVGKGFGAPAIVDWSTRNQLVLQLPLAIFVLGTASLLLDRWPQWRAAALGSVLIFSIAIRIDTYLLWEAQAIKDESIRVNVARQAAKYHLLVFHDRYVIVDAGKYVNDIPLWWSYLLKHAFGDFTRFGLYERDAAHARSARRYTADDVSRIWLRDRVHPPHFDPAAPQAGVIIDRGPAAGSYGLLMPYYLARIRGPEPLQRFLSGVTTLSIFERQ